MGDSLKGRFLLAGPSLQDPNFYRTVVFLCEHGEQGALGLVVNRPSPFTIAEAFPEVDGSSEIDESLRQGGPVQPSSVFILHNRPQLGGKPVSDGIFFAADLEIMEQLFQDKGSEDEELRFRLFAGFAGWGEGQLEFELSQNSWIIGTPTQELVFSVGAIEAWSEILTSMGGNYALIAHAPPDPSLN